ncbi:divalent-cation tolerance protein CutA [Bdellovibrionota bacterium]
MILVYVTCENEAEAKKIGKHLLEKRLCACVNILPQMHSLYYWPPKANKIEESNEAVLLIKSVKENYEAIEKEVIEIHSYETPVIFSLHAEDVSDKYHMWLMGEIKGQ